MKLKLLTSAIAAAFAVSAMSAHAQSSYTYTTENGASSLTASPSTGLNPTLLENGTVVNGLPNYNATHGTLYSAGLGVNSFDTGTNYFALSGNGATSLVSSWDQGDYGFNLTNTWSTAASSPGAISSLVYVYPAAGGGAGFGYGTVVGLQADINIMGTAVNDAGTVAGVSNPQGSAFTFQAAWSNAQGSTFSALNVGDVHLLGAMGGQASVATAINNSDEVGGYFSTFTTVVTPPICFYIGTFCFPLGGGTTTTVQNTAFLTGANGVGEIPIFSPVSTADSTDLLFLNNNGEAIVEDTTAHDYFLYNGGTLYSLNTLFGSSLNGFSIDGVDGLSDTGQILMNISSIATGDPFVVGTQATILPSSGAGVTAVSSLPGYSTFDTIAPGAAFTPPGILSPGDSGSGGARSVPAPAVSGLFGLALALTGLMRRRKQALSSV